MSNALACPYYFLDRQPMSINRESAHVHCVAVEISHAGMIDPDHPAFGCGIIKALFYLRPD